MRVGRIAIVAALGGPLLAACALFSDLNGNDWTLADSGTADAACVADANGGDGGACPSSGRFCASSADCDNGQLCCLTANSTGSVTIACQSTSSCSSIGLAFQLCSQSAECTNGGPCTAQQCPGVTAPISACSTIPVCTTP